MRRLLRNQNLLRLILLVALMLVFGRMTEGATYSVRGISNILLQSSLVGMAAIGQTFVVLTGAIDISLYGIGVLASVFGAAALTSREDLNIFGGPLPVAAGIAIIFAVGVAMGAINGLLVSRFRVPSLITTLGTWQVGYGLAQLIGGGYTITSLPPEIGVIGQGQVLGVPVPIIEMFVLFVIAYGALHHTSFGRAVYAVGGNSASAYLSGIKVRRIVLLVFIISGFMIGVASLSIVSRTMEVSVRTLSNITIDSITAVAIGGVSIYGGRGTIVGVLLGTLILTVIDSSLGAIGASTEFQNTVKGALIIAAISIDYFVRSTRSPQVVT